MKPVLLPLVQKVAANVAAVVRSNRRDIFAPIPMLQRITPKYMQLMTQLGGVTVLGDYAGVDYPMTDIGLPDKWDKVVKGVIKSSVADKLPFDRANKAAVFADAMGEAAVVLLSDSTTLLPVEVLDKPSNLFVFVGAQGKSLTWAYPNSNAATTRMSSLWTSNPLQCPEVYGVVRDWHKEALNVFPKDNKLSGIAVSAVGPFLALHLVSRPLNVVVTLTCSPNTAGYDDVSYFDQTGGLIELACAADGSYTEKKGKDMKVNLVDVGKLYQKQENVSAEDGAKIEQPVVEAEPDCNAKAVDQSVQAVLQEPVNQEFQHTAGAESAEAKPEHQEAAPETFEQLAEDMVIQFNELRDRLKDALTDFKALYADLKQLIKFHNSELKAVKAQTKENEELSKLRSAFSSMAKTLEQLKG